MGSAGSKISFSKVFEAWFISNLGRYIPGKVWQFLGMVYLLEKEGSPKRNTLTTVILGNTFSVLSSVVLAIIFLQRGVFEKTIFKSWEVSLFSVLFFICLTIFVIFPKILEKSINFFLKLLKKECLVLNLKTIDVLKYLIYYIVYWLLFGIGFFFLVSSMTKTSLNLYPGLSGAFAFSMTLGFLALFAPGGIGVRDGALAMLLSLYFPLPVATMIALSSRIWVTVVEVICFLVALSIKILKDYF